MLTNIRQGLYRVTLFYQAFVSPNANVQHHAQIHLVQRLAKRNNLKIYHKYLMWYTDPEYLAVYKAFPESNDVIDDKNFNLFQLAQRVREFPGDTAECGVYRGKTSFLICAVNQQKPSYRHHVFDSFQGLSQPGPEDLAFGVNNNLMGVTKDDIEPWEPHDWQAGLDVVKNNLRAFDFVEYYPGWIPERFSDVGADVRFSFVHIDVDLYQPAYDSLVFFYERVVPGGILICDDYGYANSPGVRKAFNEFIVDKPERRVTHLTTGQGFIIKQ
jgi:O-methyltransferase